MDGCVHGVLIRVSLTSLAETKVDPYLTGFHAAGGVHRNIITWFNPAFSRNRTYSPFLRSVTFRALSESTQPPLPLKPLMSGRIVPTYPPSSSRWTRMRP